MGQNNQSKKSRPVLKAICIIATYIIMYSVFSLCMGLLENNSIAFAVFLVICLIFTFKSCKGQLADSLSFMPWPAFIVIIILLSAVIGCFTAPYHIGNWIAKRLSEVIPVSAPPEGSMGGSSGHMPEYNRIFQTMDQMSEQELDKIHKNLLTYVNKLTFSRIPLPGKNISSEEAMRKYTELFNKEIEGGSVYGCRTYGEAEQMNKAVVACLDKKYP